MAKSLILLLPTLCVAWAQQITPGALQSTDEVAFAASKGNNVALQQLRTRAEQGNAEAQGDLGVLYYGGQGVPKDLAQAAAWYRKAAEQGLASAQSTLGALYYRGEGVSQDFGQAEAWFRKAADQGLASAENFLGLMYSAGDGLLPQDIVVAYMWFNLAAAHGHKSAMIERARAESQMTPQQVALAQTLSRDREVALARLSRVRKPAQQGPASAQGALANKRFVPMLQEGGVYKVPVFINDQITLNFVLDSGAADVSIPADVVTTLMRTETITQSDFKGAQTYTLADGSTKSELTFRIRSLKVGDVVLQDVMGSVANQNGDLLLGQSFLGRFKSWSIDNTKHVLVLQ